MKTTIHMVVTCGMWVLTKTFGTWEEERSDEEIIKEIYDSRNSNLTLT